MDSLASKIGIIIRKSREGLGMSRESFAEKIDKTVGFVGQMERGESLPKFETLRSIVNVLNMDANVLFKEGDVDPDQFAELETVFRQLNENDRQFLLSFARLLLQYSKGDPQK